MPYDLHSGKSLGWQMLAQPAGCFNASSAPRSWRARSPTAKLPETRKRFETEGAEPDIRTPAEVRTMLPIEMAKWVNVAKVANIRTQ
jgi:tripartite-type tricarboxylate transporter receptor subunit TctC